MEVLKYFSYGSELRDAIEKIISSGRGALIVFVNTKKIFKICYGGFKINTDFSKEKLIELSKLDGAILVDKSLKKILFANVLLSPNPKIPSLETGTRHQAADRTAKQFKTMVLSISEKSGKATVYYGYRKFELSKITELFARAREHIAVLEKQEQIFKELIKKLNVAELLDLVKPFDLILIFQRKRIIEEIRKSLDYYICELGKEARLFEIQLKEIMEYINSQINYIAKDYSEYFNFKDIIEKISKLSYSKVLNAATLFKIFKSKKINETENLIPKGYRLLKNIHSLTEEDINNIVEKFGNLKNIINADKVEMRKVKGIGERKIKALTDYLLKTPI